MPNPMPNPTTISDLRSISIAKTAFTVNGKADTVELDTRTTLLDALREHLHLTGTKKGCDHGQCGACTVIVNGRRINSCLTLAVMHVGRMAAPRTHNPLPMRTALGSP